MRQTSSAAVDVDACSGDAHTSVHARLVEKQHVVVLRRCAPRAEKALHTRRSVERAFAKRRVELVHLENRRIVLSHDGACA